MKKIKKCDKCDDRGMIADKEIKGAAHSCKCGYHNYLSEVYFEGAGIEDLLGFLHIRNKHKYEVQSESI